MSEVPDHLDLFLQRTARPWAFWPRGAGSASPGLTLALRPLSHSSISAATRGRDVTGSSRRATRRS
jgi:hypothetical protein